MPDNPIYTFTYVPIEEQSQHSFIQSIKITWWRTCLNERKLKWDVLSISLLMWINIVGHITWPHHQKDLTQLLSQTIISCFGHICVFMYSLWLFIYIVTNSDFWCSSPTLEFQIFALTFKTQDITLCLHLMFSFEVVVMTDTMKVGNCLFSNCIWSTRPSRWCQGWTCFISWRIRARWGFLFCAQLYVVLNYFWNLNDRTALV